MRVSFLCRGLFCRIFSNNKIFVLVCFWRAFPLPCIIAISTICGMPAVASWCSRILFVDFWVSCHCTIRGVHGKILKVQEQTMEVSSLLMKADSEGQGYSVLGNWHQLNTSPKCQELSIWHMHIPVFFLNKRHQHIQNTHCMVVDILEWNYWVLMLSFLGVSCQNWGMWGQRFWL